MGDTLTSTATVTAAPNLPLFTLDLGANGGVFAPTTVEEMQRWVAEEWAFWSWAMQHNFGSHHGGIRQGVQSVSSANDCSTNATRLVVQGDMNGVQQQVEQARVHLNAAFVEWGLPHSSTPQAKRVAALKDAQRRALGYVYPFLSHKATDSQSYPFDARDKESWSGYVEGLIDKYDIVTGVEPRIAAEREALQSLRARADKLLADKTEEVDQIHRDIAQAAGEVATTKQAQVDEFATLVGESKKEHGEALIKHAGEMETLRKTFREAMALRAPVTYWEAKAKKHSKKAAILLGAAFASMAALAGFGVVAAWAFWTITGQSPDAWKLAVLGLIAVLGVWAVRLVVRLYLSHAHLATDAEERVTMVQTYLALLEGEKMPSDEDRKLILAPLFRPGTDGLVKDEGIPHPLLELFTRSGAR